MNNRSSTVVKVLDQSRCALASFDADLGPRVLRIEVDLNRRAAFTAMLQGLSRLTVTAIQYRIRRCDLRSARRIRVIRNADESRQSLRRVDTREASEFGRDLIRHPGLPAAAAFSRFRSTTSATL